MQNKKLVLLILDGWGCSENKDHNAVYKANAKNFNKLFKENPSLLMNASGEYVGLPDGQMGNSEVGHTNIGAGRIVYQDLLRINMAIDNGDINNNKNITDFFKKTADSSGRLHFFGLLSDGGVHSHIKHLKGLIKFAKNSGIKEVYVHAFMDGRDTPPKSGISFIKDLEKFLEEENFGHIATVSGRFYPMDRDTRWDRVEKAFNAIRFGKGLTAPSAHEAVLNAYENDLTDEFIEPTLINKNGIVKDGDSVFFFNFRADRAREITKAFTFEDFDKFDRGNKPKINYMTLTEYDESFDVPVAFAPEELKDIFGEVISKKGLKQLRIAETEKYAHVTFFFNGGREQVFDGEIRCLVDSPREVATYDEKPEMSVFEVTKKFKEYFESDKIDVVIMNFANPDMVGHTGNEDAAIKACKAVDNALGQVIESINKMNAVLIVTADHGNSEEMWDSKNNQPQTAHTTNKVPFIVYNYDCHLKTDVDAKLADIAPTMLEILDMDIPEKMTGISLIAK
jgi:2,3-bisphosphoglycerate-independent phosphoglycerate mutase